MSKRGMIVAGVMSGTSADGIDVAFVRIADAVRRSTDAGSRAIELVSYASYTYSPLVRRTILSAMNAPSASVADLARLNFLLGELYAKAVLAAQARFRVRAELVGCHGQTLYHQGQARQFLGRRISTTWQTGEAGIIAARVGVPVVSDFRPADMAAGGKGAPLVPYLDYLWFRNEQIGRIVQNVGGIANLTAIPAGARPEDVIAFDSGPGNMVIDAVTQALFGRPFDRDGKIAASGDVITSVVEQIMRQAFFLAKPPKTAGREEFGREFVTELLRLCRRARKQDVIATATALTARSIADAVRRFLLLKIHPSGKTGQKRATPQQSFSEMILSGGGARNGTLVGMIAEQLAPLGILVRLSDEFGLPSEAKEAVAFAVLAYETWNRRPSNVPSATGAKRAVVLGKVSYAG
jgi:anhydro-N-acetylmuramic acid kinase